MKNFLFLSVLSVTLFSACGNNKEAATETATADTTLQYFGDSLTQEGAIAADQFATQMAGKDSMKVKLEGKIEEVCQKKGCWMTMNIGNDKKMQVKFKDYAFFVPKDASGKTVVIEGMAYTDTVQVAELKHYAEDGGKTKEEIEKITEPEIAISFEANGVIIKK